MSGGVKLRKCAIVVSGCNNSIEFNGGIYENLCIHIYGNNNKIILGNSQCRLSGLDITVEDDNNEVVIGNESYFAGHLSISCMEGTKILIGNKCLFSSNIVMRTGDSHSILNMAGERINNSKDITISDHVWVGQNVTLLKGVVVEKNNVIGSGALVTNSFLDNNVIIAGNPAKIIKKDIQWDKKRIRI